MRALLIRTPHIEKILDGKKTWEIRGSRTNVRGMIGLIRSGSGNVIGVCKVIDCIGPLTSEQFLRNARKAAIKPSEAVRSRYKKTFAWVITNPCYLRREVSYTHPRGAVIWVKLDSKTEKAVRGAS